MIEKKEINYAKEIGDVLDLIKALVVTIKTKGDYTALVAPLVTAIAGIDQVDDEFKADIEASINTITIGANGIVWALVKNPFEKDA